MCRDSFTRSEESLADGVEHLGAGRLGGPAPAPPQRGQPCPLAGLGAPGDAMGRAFDVEPEPMATRADRLQAADQRDDANFGVVEGKTRRVLSRETPIARDQER